MGQVYLLKKKDFTYNEVFENTLILIFKEVLTAQEAKDFAKIQKQISSEITEPINLLSELYLTEYDYARPKTLIFCLAKKGKKCIGYGYGYIDDENTFCIDTIGVLFEHKGEKIGTRIMTKLVQYAFNNPNINQIQVITQPENDRAIRINEKLGFKLKLIGDNFANEDGK